VVVHRSPLVHLLHVEGGGVQVRRAVAPGVPGRVHEGVHGVGVTFGRATAGRTVDLHPVLGRGQGRHTLGCQFGTLHLRQGARQLGVGDRDLTAGRAGHDRDRGTPVTLARDQPVAQAVVDRGFPGTTLGQDLDDLFDRLVLGHAVQGAGVDQGSFSGGGHSGLARVGFTGLHHDPYRQVEGQGEVQVTLVVGGYRHDRAVSVTGQDVVGGPDGHAFAVDRVGRMASQEHPGLGTFGGLTLHVGQPGDLGAVLLERFSLFGRAQLVGQLGVDRHHEEGGSVQCVGSGGVDGDGFVASLDLEPDVGTGGATDPIALHGQHVVGPATVVDLVHVVQQALGVLGDLEVPLVQAAPDHFGAATLTPALDDLFVGQHGLVLGAPVDQAFLAVGQPTLEEPVEQPLVPLVVLGIAGVDTSGPVHADAVALERGRLGLDVAVGPLVGADVVPDRGVLGGQAEGVPPDGVQDVVPALEAITPDHVADGERLRVAHVQVTGGVGEHVDDEGAGAPVVG